MAALLFFALVQDPAVPWVEKLRSERVEERDEAAEKLKALGPAALPALRKASLDPDAEVAARASRLLRVIAVLDDLSPALRKAFPGVEEKLIDEPGAWSGLLEQAFAKVGGPLRLEDLESLAAPALREAKDVEDRVRILTLFGRIGLKKAVPAVAPFLKDDDPRVAVAAMHVLARGEARDQAPLLRPFLRDPRNELRRKAAQTLGELRDRESVPALILLLEDSHDDVREAASGAIVQNAATNEIPGIAKLLGSHLEVTRELAVRTLGKLDGKRALPELLRGLEDGSSKVRAAALDALAPLRAKESLPAILKRLADPEPKVRTGAVRLAGELGEVDALLPLLKDPQSEIRSATLEAIGPRLRERDLSLVLPLTKDPDRGVREAALTPVRDWALVEALPDVLRFLEDEERLHWNVAYTLRELGAADAAPAVRPLLRSTRRSEAVRILGNLGDRESLAEIRGFLDDADENLKQEAAQALVRLGDPGIKPWLLDRLREQGKDFRTDLVFALVEAGAREAVPDLLKALPSVEGSNSNCWRFVLSYLGAREILPDLLQRIEAGASEEDLSWTLNSLWTLDAPGVAARIRPYLGHASGRVRRGTAELLGHLGDLESADAVARLLQDSDIEVRRGAADALNHLGRRDGIPVLLEGPRPPACLNAHRRPELWKRLSRRRPSERISGTTEEVILALSGEAGLPVEGLPEGAWRKSHIVSGVWGPQSSILEDLRTAVWGPYDLVLEDDRIRILTRKDARAFWKAWWEAERK
jgi:HEAT repeat protein